MEDLSLDAGHWEEVWWFWRVFLLPRSGITLVWAGVFRGDWPAHDSQQHWMRNSRTSSFTLRAKSHVQGYFSSPNFICTAHHEMWVLTPLKGWWSGMYLFSLFLFLNGEQSCIYFHRCRDLGRILGLGCRRGRLGGKSRWLEGQDHLVLCR